MVSKTKHLLSRRQFGARCAAFGLSLPALTGLSQLGHRAERKLLFFQGRRSKGLSYIEAAIFAAVMRGGACWGRSQPSLARSIC